MKWKSLFCVVSLMVFLSVLSVSAETQRVSGKIVFVNQKNLWIADADGKHQKQLTKSRDCSEPSWDPTGTKIVYVRTKSLQYRSTGAIWNYNLKNKLARKVIESAKQCLPKWSPDGKWIAYLAKNPQIGEMSTYNLEIITPSGGNRRLIKKDVGSRGYGLAWSPDSKNISYVAGEVPRLEIMDISNLKSSVIYVKRSQSTFDSIENLQWLIADKLLFTEAPFNTESGLGWRIIAINPTTRKTKTVMSDNPESAERFSSRCFVGSEDVYWEYWGYSSVAGDNYGMNLFVKKKHMADIMGGTFPSWTSK